MLHGVCPRAQQRNACGRTRPDTLEAQWLGARNLHFGHVSDMKLWFLGNCAKVGTWHRSISKHWKVFKSFDVKQLVSYITRNEIAGKEGPSTALLLAATETKAGSMQWRRRTRAPETCYESQEPVQRSLFSASGAPESNKNLQKPMQKNVNL